MSTQVSASSFASPKTTKTLLRLHRAWKRSLEYNEENKNEFLLSAKAVLKQVAVDLGFSPADYDLRVNRGGIAVSGEVILHSDRLYVQIAKGFQYNSFLFRECEGRKDYTGLSNQFATFQTLCFDYGRAIKCFRQCVGENC